VSQIPSDRVIIFIIIIIIVSTILIVIMKRASDDVSLRPFASVHFDAQAYVRGALGERRSEEALNEVDRHIQVQCILL
jgi:hypothetical protein